MTGIERTRHATKIMLVNKSFHYKNTLNWCITKSLWCSVLFINNIKNMNVLFRIISLFRIIGLLNLFNVFHIKY